MHAQLIVTFPLSPKEQLQQHYTKLRKVQVHPLQPKQMLVAIPP